VKDFANETPSLQRIRVIDPFEMGRLVVQWTLQPGSRPNDVAALRSQLRGIAEIPEGITSVGFCENTLGHLAIALPAPETVSESLERLDDPEGPLDYPIPQFYQDHYRPGLAPIVTPLDMLYARIGDSTLAQCR
jgi:hypothetical protein